jgi:hypothetical protein
MDLVYTLILETNSKSSVLKDKQDKVLDKEEMMVNVQ